MRKRTEAEILAPAGTREALTAAVRCGANAVYLGGKLLNARRNAENFDDEALKEAVRYCHERGVKVYLTLNTLVRDAELKDAEHMLALSCESGIDALIIQDLGIARLAQSCAPAFRCTPPPRCRCRRWRAWRSSKALASPARCCPAS